MTQRRPLVAANWKMHKLAAEAVAFVGELRRGLEVVDEQHRVDVVVFPSAPLLPRMADALAGFRRVALGGQDLHPDDDGAHTGDTSGRQLADSGCRLVLCGHSERRADHGETDELVARKVEAARRAGMSPLLCLGESLLEREAGRTEEVLGRQLDAALGALALRGAEDPVAALIAYEPVWAIGTGRTATPEQAQQAHAFLRHRIESAAGPSAAAAARLLYGGSVKPANCAELLDQPEVDGFLVGGASLDPESFLGIIARCAR
jgi:triosephosphate isomerase (TIM)